MSVDFVTLTIAGGLVAAVSGLLLVFAWAQYRDSRAALLLGCSHLVAATAIFLLALGGAGTGVPNVLAQLLFIAAALLVAEAASAFEKRGTMLPARAAAMAAMAAAVGLRMLEADAGAIRMLQLATVSPLYGLAAYILWLGRGEVLGTRLPLMLVLAVHALMNLIGLAETMASQAPRFGIPSFANWYGIIHLESMLYFIATTLFVVALLKERSELRHQVASLTDPLTGLPNRRAFVYACERTLERCRREGTPVAVLAFDLDRFKAVNDTFGHAVGDLALQIFAGVVRATLRPGDPVARTGGEEFAALLAGIDLAGATAVAERVRTAFAEAAWEVQGFALRATLSAGIAASRDAEASLADLMERADAALYRAKLNGRDRVEAEGNARDYPRLVHAR